MEAVKTVAPRPEFYRLYNEEQIYDIISNLEIHREIPRQYNYFDSGAKHWDKYTDRLANEETPNLINSPVKLFSVNQGYLDGLLGAYNKVNIIDIGVGNAYPAKGLLAHLLEQNKLGRYIGLDISLNMLKIAEGNIEKWFGDKVIFEGYEHDISHERFSKILANEYIKKNAKDTVNLVLLLGGTLSNLRYPDGAYRTIHDSMGINDLLIHTTKLDSERTRRYFDFAVQPGKPTLALIHSLVVDLLNIDPSLYQLELGYDEQRRERYERIRLKVALTIKFTFGEDEHLVNLNKGEAILLWRASQNSALDIIHEFDRNDFYMLQSSQTEDQEYILTVSRVKRS